MNLFRSTFLALLLLIAAINTISAAATSTEVQARIDADVAAGRPVIVHVIVALCDNANQGIVKVSEELGDGQDPGSNLYWGALYGVRTHLLRSGGWVALDTPRPDDRRILDRVVLFAKLERKQSSVPVYIIADAWDGASIREALSAYLGMTAGSSPEEVAVRQQSQTRTLQAGAASHLVAYVGHNGLMECILENPRALENEAPAKSAIVLACASKPFFLDHILTAGTHPLLLTTGLMAPEAYTLDAAIRAWVGDGTTAMVTRAAAEAYARYQGCGITAARRLFWGEP